MDKRVKKLLACTLSATMVIGSSTTVFAAGTFPSDQSSTGTVTIENDNSTAPDYVSVSLPTIATNTYNFEVDPDQLLSKYDPDNYTAGTSLYFKSTETGAKLEVASGKTVYERSYVVSSTDALKGALTGSGGAVTGITGVFCVWVPDSANAGRGKYEKLTNTNITDYFKVEFDTDNSTIKSVAPIKSGMGSLTGSNPFDGKVYEAKYEAHAAGEQLNLADYGTLGGSTGSWTFSDNTGVLFSDNTGADTAATTAAGDFTIVDPVVTHNGKSDVISIVNKSTKKATVTAKVEVENIDGLAFGDSATLDATDDLVMAITDGKNYEFIQTPEVASGAAATVATTAAATFTVNLDKAKSDVLVYQVDGATQNNNGSHEYAQYEAPGTTYSSVALYLTGLSQKTANWDTYLENQTAAASIKVTYSIAEAAADVTVSAATASVTWDRTSDLTIDVATSLVPSMAAGDFGVNYQGKVYAYTGVYNSDTTVASKNLASLAGNVITLKPEIAQFLPAGSILYIVDASQAIVSQVTIN
jgi:hypothetical protein